MLYKRPFRKGKEVVTFLTEAPKWASRCKCGNSKPDERTKPSFWRRVDGETPPGVALRHFARPYSDYRAAAVAQEELRLGEPGQLPSFVT